jgi:hypothetical protein
VSIPNRVIFIWFGERLPFTALLALRSAVRVARPEQTLLIHRGLSPTSEGVAEALAEPGVELVEADERWFAELPEGGALAQSLFRELESPASRANLMRLAALWCMGGVYLDTDTITVRSLSSLRDRMGFCGLETLVYPASYFDRRTAGRRAAAGMRKVIRAGCSRMPTGDQWFRLVEPLFPTAVNNAVLGACPRNPIVAEAFAAIGRMEPATQRKRFALGTHLLQHLTRNRSCPEMTVFPSEYFYPLGPEVSIHWFSPASARRIDDMVRTRTHVVHWYSSLESRLSSGPLTRSWVTQHATTAFARLAAPYLD